MALRPLVPGLMGRDWYVDGSVTLDRWNPEVPWADLQASPGAAIGGAGKTFVDNLVSNYGTRKFRLRITTGRYAPAWVKTNVGSYIVVDCQDGTQGSVPKWWTSSYVSYYQDFQNKMAALYDGVIDLVWETGGMSIYDEPFQRQFYSTITKSVTNKTTGVVKTGTQWAATNRVAAVAAGYVYGTDNTSGTDRWALKRFREIMTAAWTETRVGQAYNAVQYIDSSGNGVSDQAESRRQMELWWSAMGERHTIQNNSIRSTMITNSSRPWTSTNQLYKDILAMHAKGCPISFQTAQSSLVVNLQKTVEWAIDMGGYAVELPRGFESLCSGAQRTSWNADLVTNAGSGVTPVPDTTVLKLFAAEYMADGSGVPAYDSGDATAQADVFRLIIPNPGFDSFAATIKGIDPDILILPQMSATYYEDAPVVGSIATGVYLKNLGGDYLRRNSEPDFHMRPTNGTWKSNRLSLAQAILAESGDYDGVFYEDLFPSPIADTYNHAVDANGATVGTDGWPVDPGTSAKYVIADYLDDVQALLANNDASTSGIVAGNGLQQGSLYAQNDGLFTVANYLMAENFVRGPTTSVSTYRTESAWKADVDMLVAAEAASKTVLAMTKVWTTATQSQIDKWHRYALATFFLGAQDYSMFSFRQDHSRDAAHRYWTVDPGRPSAAYSKLSSGLYFRPFTDGRVYVNPTASAITVSLGGTYSDLEGNEVTSLTVAAHDGMVLSSETVIHPPPDDPPIAGLAVTKVALTASANASSSTAGTNSIASYEFDWGDGVITHPAPSSSATHTYAAPGTYVVTVTVRDTTGLQDTATKSVTVTAVSPPVPSLLVSGNVLTASADASASHAGTYPISTYTFDWGDTNTTGPQAGATSSHGYAANGTYVVTVTVTDDHGNTASTTRSVSLGAFPPIARLAIDVDELDVDATAAASTGGTYSISTYTFDWGDGNTTGPQAGVTASHTYALDGTYTVTVTATDTNGFFDDAFLNVDVAAIAPPPPPELILPVAHFTTTVVNLEVGVFASSSEPGTYQIESYTFDWDDGDTTGPQGSDAASHLYDDPGTYDIVVTVEDTHGNVDTEVKSVTAEDPDFATIEPPTARLSVFS
jgi:PKD repeat protein